ncbi:MAG: hypothetical protein CMJ52_11600 [Planctomycetaceae bacterium]|nr:hypothetical protein [Planctomycetaceae bacterium]
MSGIDGVDGGDEGGDLPLAVLLGVLLQVALRIVPVLLLLRHHALGVHAQLLQCPLQLVVLLPQFHDVVNSLAKIVVQILITGGREPKHRRTQLPLKGLILSLT